MKKRPAKNKKKKTLSPWRRWARRGALACLVLFLTLCGVGDWFVHHDAAWMDACRGTWPAFLLAPLDYFGDRTGLLTDSLGWTGLDVVYATDEPAPESRVFFAGAPRRRGAPAPEDVVTLDYGEFVVGWSPSLRHAAWCAYHVPRTVRFESGKRPNFTRDKSVAQCPAPSAYARTGYDRGHLAPNHAIETRFGPDAQKKTFYMTNVAPQAPALNQGPWRVVERLVADFWTARWGEMWVLAGPVPNGDAHSRETLAGTSIDVPVAYWMIVVAQSGEDVRILPFAMSQNAGRHLFPVRCLTTVKELERLTGYDFLPELPEFLARPLESEKPTRLWPIRWWDVFSLVTLDI